MDVVGIDIGFGFTKATNGRASLVFKSIFGEASEIQFRERFLENAGSEEHLHIETDKGSFFVGELAERQSNVRSFTLDQDQLISGFAEIMSLAALARLGERNRPLRVVTGLPISYYRRHREELARLLTGKHALKCFDLAGTPSDTVVNVTHVRVIPQPFGTLFHLALNNHAEIGDRRFVHEKIGIIDIGFRTCDFTIADRTRYSERGSRTSESGMAKAYALIAAHLRELTGVNVELYRLYDAVAAGTIKIRGRPIGLEEITAEVLGKLAAAIASDAERLWADDWDIDRIVLSGGGAAVLAPHLKPLLQGEVLGLDPAADPRLANVLGYWKYGMNLWGREARAATAAKS